jgi:hypothetical protein
MKFFAAILFLTLAACGCVTKSAARLQQQNAFLAGQNAILRQQQAAQTASVTVLGPVQNPTVPWVAGLTLAQAVATANYLHPNEPKVVILTHQGESVTLDPQVLLGGPDIPLEAGDVVEIRP